MSMGWLVLNLLEYLGGFSTKYIFLINVKCFKNIFLKENFLKEKEESFGIFFLGMESLKLIN